MTSQVLLRFDNTRQLVLPVKNLNIRLVHAEQHVERFRRRRQPVVLLIFTRGSILNVDRNRAIRICLEVVSAADLVAIYSPYSYTWVDTRAEP